MNDYNDLKLYLESKGFYEEESCYFIKEDKSGIGEIRFFVELTNNNEINLKIVLQAGNYPIIANTSQNEWIDNLNIIELAFRKISSEIGEIVANKIVEIIK